MAPAFPAPAARDRLPRVEIDRAALQANWRMLAARDPAARTGAAVKANGYGLGTAEVSVALHEAGCRDFFVAWAAEGAALREALDAAGLGTGGEQGGMARGMPATRHAGVLPAPALDDQARIFVLQGLEPGAVQLHLSHRLIPILSTPDDLAVWRAGLQQAGRRAPAALQVETGMNRLGLDRADAEAAANLARSGALDLCLVMSHLASGDEESGQSADQLARFQEIAALFPGVPRSIANSAGCFLGPDYAFDLTRPGIALYGGSCGPASTGTVRPVATLTAAVLQVRTARAGEAAGYGAAARLSRDTRIATVGLGYADGYPRAASGAGVPLRAERPGAEAFLAGQRVPVLGRISMDMTLLDVTDVPQDAVRPGMRAEFFGPNVALDDVADAAGTIAYELLTGLGRRVERLW
ncbi:alanine racemase [Jiella sp. M17.18]|uniref:alanine racemase n=1 Tax=Jiella sp. M17.18 TaxID=3234247 RepID=UPI0034DE2A23